MSKLVAAIMILGLAAACATPQDPGATPDAAATQARAEDCPDRSGEGQMVTVVMEDFAFDPQCFTMSGRQGLDLDNRDDVPHTFTIDDRVDFEVQPGQQWRTEAVDGQLPAGEYRFYCRFHPEMVGRLTVEEQPR